MFKKLKMKFYSTPPSVIFAMAFIAMISIFLMFIIPVFVASIWLAVLGIISIVRLLVFFVDGE